MDKIGITTAVTANPNNTIHQFEPDFTPNEVGKIKFPAPKKSENKAKPLIQISLFLSVFICDNFVKNNNVSLLKSDLTYLC